MSIKHISIIVIITLIFVAVTALAFRLLSHDLQISAEENNAKINRMAAMETESVLANVRSNSLVLIQTITATGTQSAVAQSAINFFFEENPLVAAVLFTTGAQTDGILVNKNFFLSREIDEALANSYLNDSVTALSRASAGETLLLNATPHFIVPVLALFFPRQNGGMGVLFSQSNFNNVFFLGTNQSFLLNDSGDILIHANFESVREGVNVADNDFTRYIGDIEDRSSHGQYTDEGGIRYFRAFTKLNTGACAVITDIEYDKVFEEIDAAARRIIYLSVAFLSIAIMFIWFFFQRHGKK
jgi:adenylate cyclase